MSMSSYHATAGIVNSLTGRQSNPGSALQLFPHSVLGVELEPG